MTWNKTLTLLLKRKERDQDKKHEISFYLLVDIFSLLETFDNIVSFLLTKVKQETYIQWIMLGVIWPRYNNQIMTYLYWYTICHKPNRTLNTLITSHDIKKL